MDLSKIVSLKGEFEAEGLSRDRVAAEAVFAARNNLPYLVKIGGCEAKADMRFLMLIGVRSIVAPMIESPFAMRKYMNMLPDGAFDHVGVTIETIDAVRRIDEILDAGKKLGEVTIGRTDLTASHGGNSVDSAETVEMVKTVAHAAQKRGLKVTMGGAVNSGTIALLKRDDELRGLLACVETRKCVIPVARFLEAGALEACFVAEKALLDMQIAHHGVIVNAASSRIEQIEARL